MAEKKPVRLKKDGTPRKKPGPAKGRKHPGRRGFTVTAEMRENVQIAVASKQMTHLDIAALLGVSINTLYKHFRRDIDIGHARVNFGMLKAQYETGIKGNASAQDKWLKRAFDQPNLASFVSTSAAPKKEPRQPKLGKKEAMLLAAKNPDVSTSMGERMARRMSSVTRH